MLSIFVSWLVCGFIFVVFGKLLINICSIFLPNRKFDYSVFDSYFLGICFVGTILSILSLFIPVNTKLAWVLFAVAIVSSFYFHCYKKDHFLSDIFKKAMAIPLNAKLLLFSALIAVLFCCTLPPIVADMRLYYFQSMLWNETYPVIPGLGNIHGRLGFNSNILLLSSTFSFQDIFSQRIYGILSLSTFVMLVWIVLKITRTEFFWVKIGLVFVGAIFVHTYHPFLSSPATDVLPNVLVLYILLKAITEKDSILKSPLMYWVLPVYALTLKLSVIPICLFCLYILYDLIKNKQYKTLSFVVLLALCIISPWLARNIIITGYLIYPFPSIDIFSFDWKIPIALVQEEKDLVSSWAKMPGLSVEEYNEMPFWEWSKVWLRRHIYFQRVEVFSIFLASISPLAIFLLWKKGAIKSFTQISPWLIAFVGVVFWYILAPDARFGISFILIALVSPLLFVKKNPKKAFFAKLPYFIYIVLFLYIAYVTIPIHSLYGKDTPLSSYIYAPPAIDVVTKIHPTKFKTETVGNITIYVANNMLCADHPIPCLPYYNNNLEMRGENITDGFRIKQQ